VLLADGPAGDLDESLQPMTKAVASPAIRAGSGTRVNEPLIMLSLLRRRHQASMRPSRHSGGCDDFRRALQPGRRGWVTTARAIYES
jgi:hypothetical protein